MATHDAAAERGLAQPPPGAAGWGLLRLRRPPQGCGRSRPWPGLHRRADHRVHRMNAAKRQDVEVEHEVTADIAVCSTWSYAGRSSSWRSGRSSKRGALASDPDPQIVIDLVAMVRVDLSMVGRGGSTCRRRMSLRVGGFLTRSWSCVGVHAYVLAHQGPVVVHACPLLTSRRRLLGCHFGCQCRAVILM